MRRLFLTFLMFVPVSFLLSWGEEGHFLITRLALNILPAEMEQIKEWGNYLIPHSVDADKRKRDYNNEEFNHYIDLDFYEEFKSGKMIFDKTKLIEKYGDSLITEMGVLPWATLSAFENLTEAFKEKNRDKVLIFAADLAHYTADGHQPMHTVVNYNGQLTGQKGIHKKYESRMFEKYKSNIDTSAAADSVQFIDKPLDYIFGYIIESNSYHPVIYAGDLFAYQNSGSRESDDYYRLLWFRTKYVTVNRVKKAAKALADLYYTAWVNAGKPELKEFN